MNRSRALNLRVGSRGLRERIAGHEAAALGLFIITVLVGILSYTSATYAQTLYTAKFIPGVLGVVLAIILAGNVTTAVPVSIRITWWVWMTAQIASVFATQAPATSALILVSYLVFFEFTLRLAKARTHWLAGRWHLVTFLAAGAAVVASFILPAAPWWTAFAGRLRLRGGFQNPNALGQFCAMAAYAGFRYLNSAPRGASLGKMVVGLLVVGFTFVTYLTNSRGALAFLAIGIVLAWAWQRLWSRRAVIAAVLVMLVAAPLWVNSLPGLNELTTYRIERWQARLGDAIGNNVWFGEGMSSREPTDNSFVVMFSQAGVVGGVSGVVFALTVTASLLRVRAGAVDKVLWVAWIAYSGVESMWYSLGNPMSIYVWATVGTWLLTPPSAEASALSDITPAFEGGGQSGAA